MTFVEVAHVADYDVCKDLPPPNRQTPVHLLQPRPMTDATHIATLLRRVAAQDKAAFAEVYSATSAKLYGIALRILKRRDLADEVVQDTFVRIWQRAGDFDPQKASPISWMCAIARNRALDEVRRKQAASIEDHPEVMEFPAADSGDPLVLGEEAAKLKECLERLDPDKRQMVLLAYCEGASRDELAAKYSEPVNTVKTWLRRSLAQLKGCLADDH